MHKGKTIVKKGKYKIIDCKVCGVKHLYPLPTSEYLSEFYQKKYYNLIKKGDRAPEIRKQIAGGGEEAEAELYWLRHTLYEDIRYVLERYLYKGKKYLLDIGCGCGNFMKYMKNVNWKAIGVELSQKCGRIIKESGLVIYNMTLEKFITTHSEYKFKFDAVTLLNVLEHIPKPVDFLKLTKMLLKPYTGILCICVPNDFSKLQMYAAKKLNKNLWWVAIPDHVNYFDFKSLQKILVSLNFEILYYTTDFPMEIFLLFGEDYVNNTKVGSICHKKRINFELSIPDELRREIYHKLAEVGVGRSILIFGKRKD